VLVSGAFYLLAESNAHHHPRPYWRTTHAWMGSDKSRTSEAGGDVRLRRPVATGADFAIIRPDPLYIYVRSPRGDPPCEARWFRPWQPALIHRVVRCPPLPGGTFHRRNAVHRRVPGASVIEAGPQSGCSRAELGARIANSRFRVLIRAVRARPRTQNDRPSRIPLPLAYPPGPYGMRAGQAQLS